VPEDDPERKPSDSLVGRRVALHCYLLEIVLHKAIKPQILTDYLIACTQTANYTAVGLTHRPCCFYLK